MYERLPQGAYVLLPTFARFQEITIYVTLTFLRRRCRLVPGYFREIIALSQGWSGCRQCVRLVRSAFLVGPANCVPHFRATAVRRLLGCQGAVSFNDYILPPYYEYKINKNATFLRIS